MSVTLLGTLECHGERVRTYAFEGERSKRSPQCLCYGLAGVWIDDKKTHNADRVTTLEGQDVEKAQLIGRRYLARSYIDDISIALDLTDLDRP